MSSVISNKLKLVISELDKNDRRDINNVLRGKAPAAYKRLRNEFVASNNDAVIIKAKIDNVEEFYNKNVKEMTGQQQRRLQNYIASLNNVFYAKSFSKTFIDADGNVKDTFVGVRKTTIKEPQTGASDEVKEIFDLILANKPNTLNEISDRILKLKMKELKQFSREIRTRYGDRVPYSNKIKPALQQDIFDYIKNTLIPKEKLTQLEADISTAEKAGEMGEEYEKVKEKIEKVEKGEAEELNLENPVQEEIYDEIEMQKLLGDPFDINDYIKNKLTIDRDKQITEFLLTYDTNDKSVKYVKSPILPQNYSKKSIRDTFDKILLNNIYIDRLKSAIMDADRMSSYKQMGGQDRARYINDRIQNDITPADLTRALQDPEIIGFFNQIQGVLGVAPSDPTIQSYHELSESIRGLKHSDDKARLADIAKNIIRYSRIYDDKEKQLENEINTRVNVPKGDVPILPEGVKIKRAEEEEIMSDLDKYNAIMKEVAEMKKKPPSARTPLEEQQIKDTIHMAEAYKEGAKKEKAQKTKKDLKTATATKRSGSLRPHFTIPNEKQVQNAISETPQEQIQDIKNWYIFDLPNYSTGVGNKLENPLVKQNTQREWNMVSGTDIFTNTIPFLLTDGVDERKDFGNANISQLSRKGIDIGLQNIKWDETEEQFLQRFNSGSNGLFDQDQTKEEVSDFKPIYQKPARYIEGSDNAPQFTNNNGMTHNNKQWIDNLNLFYKGATIE